MERTIKFIANAVRWFDKVNGNTYHSVRVTRCADGQTIAVPFQYGYGESYRHSALSAMAGAGWLGEKYQGEHANGSSRCWSFDTENGYPIQWEVRDGKKRECVANGER